MKVLQVNDFTGNLGGAEVAIKNILARSSHKMDWVTSSDFNNMDIWDINNYDLIHLHNVFNLDLHQLMRAWRLVIKYVISLHDHRFNCLNNMLTCETFNKWKNCLVCQGLLNYPWLKMRQATVRKLVEKAERVVVFSPYMADLYEELTPTYLPICLETEQMTLLADESERGDYLFYSSRASYEKNPQDFVRLCRDLDVRGIMALDYMPGHPHFKDYVKLLRDPHVELHYDVELEELFDFYRHARLTVHPHKYLEPFGIGSINSILLGTPLLTYAHGNLRDFSEYWPLSYPTLRDITRDLLEDPELYQLILDHVRDLRDILLVEHGPVAVDRWDEAYELC